MYDEKEVLLVTNDLREVISYDEWSAREYGETQVDFDWTARKLIDKGYHKQRGWISVEDMTPEASDDYLVYLKYTPLTKIVTKRSYSKERGWYGVQSGHYYTEVGVTHWMPLPAPPTE